MNNLTAVQCDEYLDQIVEYMDANDAYIGWVSSHSRILTSVLYIS